MAIYNIPTAQIPVVNYTISMNDTSIALSSNTKVSFNAPYNKINVTLRATDNSPSYFEARITKDIAEWGVGIGNLAHYIINVALNTDYSFVIPINTTLFNDGDGIYRISLCAKSSVDNTWDIQAILLTTGSKTFIPADADGFEVYIEEDRP